MTGEALKTSATADVTGLLLAWKNRAHFFAISARLMRRILVDFARRRSYLKRGGGVLSTTLHDDLAISAGPSSELTDIDDALKALESFDARKARVVELRFFGGLIEEETAEVLKVSADTVMWDWKFAKVWLQRELTKEAGKKIDCEGEHV